MRSIALDAEQARLSWVSLSGSPIGFDVSEHEDKKEAAHLEQLNAELTDSLARCRELLSDCRSKLAVSSDEPDDEADSQGVKN